MVAFPDDTIVPEVMNDKLITNLVSLTVINANITLYSLQNTSNPDHSFNPLAQQTHFNPHQVTFKTEQDESKYSGWAVILSVDCFDQDGSQVL